MADTPLALGIELGSTRIKATVIDDSHRAVASGSFGWENQLVDGVWTYDMSEVWSGLSATVGDLLSDMAGSSRSVASIAGGGVSAMMHGYLALDENDEVLVPFRTWRNNITARASAELTERFNYPVPQRWSIAHLYQAMLNEEEHLPRLARITTLAGYVHYQLTGRHVIGINDASGMFPIDVASQDYDQAMIESFDALVKQQGLPWRLRDLLPTIVPAGEIAGTLSEEGARRLDPSGRVVSGLSLCAPEGDAGTGMVATNAVRPRGGNVSAGTSVFAMIVLEQPLSRAHEELDLVVTPGGKAVAMAHSNNCTSDFDAWVRLLVDAATVLGSNVDASQAFGILMRQALEAELDAGGLTAYGYVSGEHITGFSEGRPLFVRGADSRFNLPNFVRVHLMAALGALRTGLDILTREEKVEVDEIRGHGGFFKTPEVGQRIMAAATGVPVSVMETAGEGGAWGMAVLARYMISASAGQDLPTFLDHVFAESSIYRIEPTVEEISGFNTFFERYTSGLSVERAAVDSL